MDQTAAQNGCAVFGRRLQQERQRLRLSPDQLADRLGMSVDEIALIEAGGSNITLDTMVRLSDAVGREVWEMVG